MKLVTWNVQWCRGVDGVVDPRRIVEHARAFAGDVDVFCLQEVAANFPALAGSRGEDQFAELAALLPGFTAVPAIGVDLDDGAGGRRRFGNLILSRLPVRRVLRRLLPWPADAVKRSMPRIAVEVLVEAPFGPLRVTTTHLEYYSPKQRAAQVEALRDAHAEACGRAREAFAKDVTDEPFHHDAEPTAAIVTGDFNFRPEDPLHARMTAAFDDPATPPFVDAWRRLHPDAPQPPTVGVHDRVQWPERFACDFVWCSADLAPRLRAVAVGLETAASDHQPVRVELA